MLRVNVSKVDCRRKLPAGLLGALILVFLSPLGLSQEPAGESEASGRSDDYLIGPGDTLSVFVWREPDLSISVPVRPDGQISTPLVEDMIAVGKTPSELARNIEAVLAEYIRAPQVTIIVTDFVGTFASQIRVLGEVNTPGPVPYRDRMTVLDVLFEVGGLTEFASGNRARLVRNVDGKSEETRIRLEDLLNDGELRENIPVQPGDVLIVPAALF